MSEAPTLYRQGRLDQTQEQRRNAEAWTRARDERVTAAVATFDPARRREAAAEQERLAEAERQRLHPDPRAELAAAHLELQVVLDEHQRLQAEAATAGRTLDHARRGEAEARARVDATLGRAASALRQAIADGSDIGEVDDPELPDRLPLAQATDARRVAERVAEGYAAAVTAATRRVAAKAAAVDRAELAVVIALAVEKAGAVEALRAQIEPLMDWLEAAAGLRVQGPGGLHPITLPAAVRRGLTPVDPVLHGRPRPLRFFNSIAAAIETAE